MIKVDWYRYFVDRVIFGFYISAGFHSDTPGAQSLRPLHHCIKRTNPQSLWHRIQWTKNSMRFDIEPIPWHRCYLL